MHGVSAWPPCNSPVHSGCSPQSGPVAAWGALELEPRYGIPKDAVVGDPPLPFWIPLWPGLGRTAAWALCRIL